VNKARPAAVSVSMKFDNNLPRPVRSLN